jgi:1-acyl-sn-glycerol-3-phosphate acyltransferase
VRGVFYRFMRIFVLYLPLRVLFRVRYVHPERMPKHGPAVLASSHASYLDPLLLGLVRAAPIHYMGKSELFEGNRFLAWFLRAVCVFPVRRGTADRHAVAQATELLEQGAFVGIFPEGTRGSGDMGDAMGGAAFIAMRTGAPVIPACLNGTDRIMPKGARFPRFPKVTIAFGEPVLPAEFTEGGRRERVDAMTAVMMERVRQACVDAGRGA